MTGKKEGILSGITMKAIILGVILALFNIWVAEPYMVVSGYWISSFLVRDNTYGDTNLAVSIFPRFFTPLGIMVWACLIMLLINRSRPGTFSLQEAATVFMIVFAAGYLSTDFYLYGLGDTMYSITQMSTGLIHWVADPAEQAEAFTLLPSLWPQKEVAQYWYDNMLMKSTGTFSIYWPYWSGLFAWKWIYNLGGIFMFVGIATLLRRQMVEVEALSFPFATLATEVVQISQPNSRKLGNILKNKWFLIGFIIMALWMIIPMAPVQLANRGQADTKTYMWKELNPYRQPGIAFGDLAYHYITTGHFAYNAWPFMIGWCYLWPIGELAGGLVGAGILTVWVYIGLINGIVWIYPFKPTPDRGSVFGNPLHMLLDRWGGVLFGFTIALVAIPAIRHRNLVIQQLKSIFEEPDDPDKPVTYRTTWLILIAGFVLLVLAGVLLGVHAGAWTLFVILNSILAIGLIRVVSANGGWFFNWVLNRFDSSWCSYAGVPLLFMFGLTGLNATTLWSAYMFLHADMGRLLWGAVVSAMLLLAFYKVGKQTKTKEKTVLIGGTIGLVLVSIFGIVFGAMLWEYMEGAYANLGYGGMYLNYLWNQMKVAATPLDAFFDRRGMAGCGLVQAPDYWLLAVVIGFAIIAVFSLLQQRYSWFLVSATGIFTGATFAGQLWLPMLLAIILKVLTLRVGGTQKYEEIGKPMAVGTLAGTGFIFIIQFIIYTVNRIALGAVYPA